VSGERVWSARLSGQSTGNREPRCL
jgi:hypothetical protein